MQVVQQVFRAEEIVVQHHLNVHGILRKQFKTIVVVGQGKGDFAQKTDAVAQQAGHGLMDKPPFEGIEDMMVSVPGLEGFDQ